MHSGNLRWLCTTVWINTNKAALFLSFLYVYFKKSYFFPEGHYLDALLTSSRASEHHEDRRSLPSSCCGRRTWKQWPAFREQRCEREPGLLGPCQLFSSGGFLSGRMEVKASADPHCAISSSQSAASLHYSFIVMTMMHQGPSARRFTHIITFSFQAEMMSQSYSFLFQQRNVWLLYETSSSTRWTPNESVDEKQKCTSFIVHVCHRKFISAASCTWATVVSVVQSDVRAENKKETQAGS